MAASRTTHHDTSFFDGFDDEPVGSGPDRGPRRPGQADTEPGAAGGLTDGDTQERDARDRDENAREERAGRGGRAKRGTRAVDPTPRRPEAGDARSEATRRVRASAEAERARTSTRRRAETVRPNPVWLVPLALTLLVLGLAYLVTAYLSSGQLPAPIGDWNLAVGFGMLMLGGALLMFWK
ncbi:cell division protein CrgA [Brachybacterium sp. EF45031]|uniref:cell division protein CrgA n=1 Tax=Brachybacterium sillae TaxID=2810536 RepID=UPI00255996E0|nr:cell division protein CrgA [Brachybacterium sillae]MCS6712066.1 cell division protein CrgA [Brachybacterium sillae]